MKEFINITKRVAETVLKFIGLAFVARYALDSNSVITEVVFIIGVVLLFIREEI